MKVQKIIKMGCLTCFMISLCLTDVFAATRADELYQKAASEIKERNIAAAKPLLDAVLACDDANDVLRIRIHNLRARLNFENPDFAKNDCNSAIKIAKGLIAERLRGNINLSQDYLIEACKIYVGTLVIDKSLLCQDGMYNEATAINISYSEDVLKLGPFFDETGRQKIVDFAIRGWLDAAQITIEAKQPAEAHNIYSNAEGVLSKLNWTTPEMTEKAIYIMQMGALITSDVNDQAFGAAAAELIERNKTKSWIANSSINVAGFMSFERQYELYTTLIKAQPTAADDNSMAALYHWAYTSAKEVGHPEEAVTYYKTLKQKYPNNPAANLPQK
jgi:tetratricopeptide (TPR) repeat protein